MGTWSRRLGYLAIVTFSVLVTTAVWAEQGSAIPSVGGSMERLAKMSPAEQRSWVGTEDGDIQRAADVVSRMLDKARRAQDIIMERCLNDKLTQLNKNLESFRRRRDAFGNAGTDERRDHYFRLMVILSERKDALRSEAAQCVGGEDVSFGETTVTTERDPSITEDDTTTWTNLLTDLFRPATASGYY